MASIINASPTNGIVQTADGSGILKIQSNSVTTNALAWVNFNGTGTVAIRSSYNVSSITDNGTGDYTVNFATALADANYAATGGGTTIGARSFGMAFNVVSSSGAAAAPTTTTLRLSTFQPSANTAVDGDYVYVAIFGN